MAGHLAAQEAVWAGPPAPPPTLCFLFLSAQQGQWGLQGGARGLPVPAQTPGSHLGTLECVGSASGPRVQH